MGCVFCSGRGSLPKSPNDRTMSNTGHTDQLHPPSVLNEAQENAHESAQSSVGNERDDRTNLPESSNSKAFTFAQLVAATHHFKAANFLGEGGFGKVYKGILEDSGQIVAIKQLKPDGGQGIREFVVEVLTLNMADHPNLVKLIGYCAEGEQRLLIYEYMPLGSLADHLHSVSPNRKWLDWNARMKIAAGAARGLAYLHNEMKPPVIYRDMKSANILLNEEFHAKLSDFGMAKVGPVGDKTHVSTRVMGTYGYCAPEYAMTGQLTYKSDIYSLGVVLLELISGRKAFDTTKPAPEQYLVSWARPLIRDRRKFTQMADPVLEGKYPLRGLFQAITIAAMCVQELSSKRPVVTEVVTALNFLASQTYDPSVHQSASSSSSHKSRTGSTSKEKNPDQGEGS